MFKADIKWREPRAFKQAAFSERKRPSPWLCLLPALFLMPLWYNKRDESGVPFWVMLCAGIGLGAFLVYGVPWLYSVLPTEVALFKKALIRQDRQQPIPIPYESMRSFSIDQAGGVGLLAITQTNGQTTIIGIADTVDRDQLREYLEDKGVPHQPTPEGDSAK